MVGNTLNSSTFVPKVPELHYECLLKDTRGETREGVIKYIVLGGFGCPTAFAFYKDRGPGQVTSFSWNNGWCEDRD